MEKKELAHYDTRSVFPVTIDELNALETIHNINALCYKVIGRTLYECQKPINNDLRFKRPVCLQMSTKDFNKLSLISNHAGGLRLKFYKHPNLTNRGLMGTLNGAHVYVDDELDGHLAVVYEITNLKDSSGMLPESRLNSVSSLNNAVEAIL